MAEMNASSRDGGVMSKDISVTQRSCFAGITEDHSCIFEDFEDMNLRKDVLQSVKARAFTKPLPLQQRAIVPLTLGYDVVVKTYPGSGKKTIVSMVVLQTVNVSSKTCQVLVLTPTASAAECMKQKIMDMGECLSIQCHVCTGERRLKEDIHMLREGVHVVIGTLERTYDLVNRNVLKKCALKLLVIEDAGEMFFCASKSGISDLIKTFKSNIQLLFLTTNIEKCVLNEFRNFLCYPAFLVTQNKTKILDNTEHFYIPISNKQSKLEILLSLYKRFIIKQAIIFCQTEQEAKIVAKNMRTTIENVFLYDEQLQQETDRVFREFLEDDIHTLVTTDGHDFRNVLPASLIINYDFPTTDGKYNLRTSRKNGTNHKVIVISFITENEQQMLPLIESLCEVKINKIEISNTNPCNFLNAEPHCLQVKDDAEKCFPVCNDFIVHSFEESNLRTELVEGIRDYGFRRPTHLQRNAIFPCINGYDVIIHSYPRSSTTTTLAIAILQNVDYSVHCCQALVLTSTRGKAQYMHELLRELGRYMKVKFSVFYGGNPVHVDLPHLEKHTHIIVGTAGRIMDLIDRKVLRTNGIKLLVLEEVSCLLSDMQRQQTHKIFQALNSDVQIILSSAVPRNTVASKFAQFSKGSVCAVTFKSEISAHNIKQFYLPLKRGDSIYEVVSNLYIKLSIPQSVIFCNKSEKINDNKTSQAAFAECIFLDHIKSQEKQMIKENFCSVCDYSLFSTNLLLGRKRNDRISVIINYDFLIQKENFSYDSNTSYYHKAIVADIAPQKKRRKICDLDHFLA